MAASEVIPQIYSPIVPMCTKALLLSQTNPISPLPRKAGPSVDIEVGDTVAIDLDYAGHIAIFRIVRIDPLGIVCELGGYLTRWLVCVGCLRSSESEL